MLKMWKKIYIAIAMSNYCRKPQAFLLSIYIQCIYFYSTSAIWFMKRHQMKIAQSYKRLKWFFFSYLFGWPTHISWLKTHYCQSDFFLKTWWHLSMQQEHQMGLRNLVSLIYCSLSSTHHKCQRWVLHAWHLPRCKVCIKWGPLNLHESIGLGVWK